MQAGLFGRQRSVTNFTAIGLKPSKREARACLAGHTQKTSVESSTCGGKVGGAQRLRPGRRAGAGNSAQVSSHHVG
jgi:hypothetical protein